jgi:hypothetical protein
MMPPGAGVPAHVYGPAAPIWNVDGITFWGVLLFHAA